MRSARGQRRHLNGRVSATATLGAVTAGARAFPPIRSRSFEPLRRTRAIDPHRLFRADEAD
jgi:hypothetical protein